MIPAVLQGVLGLPVIFSLFLFRTEDLFVGQAEQLIKVSS